MSETSFRQWSATAAAAAEFLEAQATLRAAEEIFLAMERIGLSRVELARRLGTSAAYVTKILRGDANFTLASLAKLAQALEGELRLHIAPAGMRTRGTDAPSETEESQVRVDSGDSPAPAAAPPRSEAPLPSRAGPVPGRAAGVESGDASAAFPVAMSRLEANLERILPLLPSAAVERLRDVAEARWDDGRGIVVLVTPEAFEIRLPTVEWHGHQPIESSRSWRRLRAANISDEQLASWVEKALAAREAELRECRLCHQLVPPEHRYARDVCHGCASEHLGVVY